MHTRNRLLSLVHLMVCLPVLAADMPGASDPDGMPRVSGSQIIGFAQSDFDAGTLFVLGDDEQVNLKQPEGKRQRVLYLAAEGDTPLKIQRNYEAAIAELGDVVETYVCKNTACSGQRFATTFWTRETMLETHDVRQPFYLLGFSHVFNSPAYRSVVVTSDSGRYHIGVFSAVLADNNSNTELRGRTVTLVEVLEDADFVPSLTFVDASAMQSEIEAYGRVALYGIQFDHDSAQIKTDSEATLNEIKVYLAENDDVRLYVVGHTDDAGSLEYNQSLAARRAEAVVAHLTANGVNEARLKALGVGPASPIASNESDAGRAENRRVELVKRLN